MSSDLGPTIVRELLPQPGDDLGGLVDRERGLGDVGDSVRVRHLELVDVLGGLDEDDLLGRLAGRPLDLLVALVADEDDRVALLGELPRLDVDLGHQRAGGVDRPQPARRRVLVDRRGDAVGGEDDELALGDLGLLLDEDRAPLRQLLDHVLVVDDLLAHVDRRAVHVERVLDRLHGPVDARAVAPRRREQDPVRRCFARNGHAERVAAARSANPRDRDRGGLADRIEAVGADLVEVSSRCATTRPGGGPGP